MHPAVNFTLTVEAEIDYVFYRDQFICGYGVGLASADPLYAEVSEMGDLYINGNLIDGTDTVGIAFTADETACYVGASGSFWEMYITGAAEWLAGPVLFQDADLWSFQP
ncbi:hypothetical protein KTAU_41140 [Thermogemmatispora aurantia]|nr:hypothetical protein KTAU_41140 [Thermogemmatispora aurantia]